MMKINQILSFLEEIAPGSLQEHYDNSGLILGSPDVEASKVLVCLDADRSAIDHAILQGCDAVISHHPAIFKAIKSFTEDTREGALLVKAIKHNLALISSHTNFDSAAGGLTDHLCTRIGLNNVRILKKNSPNENYGQGRYGNIPEISGTKFIHELCTKLTINAVKLVGQLPQKISTVAVYNGSYDREILGELCAIQADTLLTGDLKYHDAQELMENGIFTIDAGHYGTEKFFVEDMAKLLQTRFPELEVLRFTGSDVFTYHFQAT